VQAALGDLAAHQIGEDAEADEEHHQAQVEELEDRGVSRRDARRGLRRAAVENAKAIARKASRTTGRRATKTSGSARPQEGLLSSRPSMAATWRSASRAPLGISGASICGPADPMPISLTQLLPWASPPIRYW
jgi:hypothetical protein